MRTIKSKMIKGLVPSFLCFAFVAVFSTTVSAQQAPPKSPTVKDSISIGGNVISVKYAAPSVRGRDIFGSGGLLSKEKNFPVWRAGANSATLFSTSTDVTINGLKVPAGTYTLFVSLVDPENWELIVNKQVGQWGLTYDAAQDLGRVKMKMAKPSAPVEVLVYTFKPDGGKKATLTLTWDKYSASVPIAAK